MAIKTILIDFDPKTSTALVKKADPSAPTPYIVAHWYHPEEGDWGQGTYFDEFPSAARCYLEAIGKSSKPEDDPDVMLADIWMREDVSDAISDVLGDEYVNEGNIDAAIGQIGSTLQDRLSETGWEVIRDCIDFDSLKRSGL